jgi:4-amino-4-deoxy-L-arabinose transferase-like glycosyltransferase
VPPLALVLAALLLLALVNPFGYRGGGADDWYYLEAARCAVAHHGPCLPTTHWAARLPIVLPVAGAIALFGETRAALAGVALLHSCAAIALFVLLVQRQSGRLEAGIAGLALVATPVVTLQLAALNIETVELTWALGALFCLQNAVRGGDRRWAWVAGMLLGIAILARTTSLLLVPIAAIGFALRPALRRYAAPAAAGLAALLALDALGYWLAAGDPLRDWRLALGHAQIPSTEIATPLGAHESPLFNRHLIAGWHRTMGVHVHWSIDALLNLFADPVIGLTLLVATALLLAERRTAPRVIWWLAGAAALDFGGLVYALAIDPKPRMFLLVLCAICAITGLIGAQIWRRGWRWPIVAWLGLSMMLAAAIVDDTFLIAPAGTVLAAWAAEAPATTAIDETTRRAFTLEPAIRTLPVAPAPGRTRLLRLSQQGCAPGDGWRPVRAYVLPDDDTAPIAALRARHLLFGPRAAVSVCLFSRG